MLFADQPTDRAAFVAVDHCAGRRGVDTHLVFDRMRAHIVARAVRQNLRYEKKRNALGAGRSAGQPRQYEVNDIVGEIVLAVSDEDFLSSDAVSAVVRALGLGP